MTRFARAEGSKASNKKVPEDATPWSQLKGGVQSEEGESDDTGSESADQCNQGASSAKDKSWSVIESKRSEISSKKRKSDANLDESFAEKRLKKSKDIPNKKKPIKEFSTYHQATKWKDDVQGIERGNKQSNKGNRAQAKQCFACRGFGHEFASCPNVSNNDACFVCGSLEHKVKDCKQRKSDQNSYKFATCFICKEVGHLSSSCPDNPRGIYPHGGSCRQCGEVTHLAKNCPKNKKQKETKQITVPTLTNDIDGLPEDNKIKKNKKQRKKVKNVTF